MCSTNYKNTDLLKFQPFSTEKIETSTRKPREKKKDAKKHKSANNRQHRKIKKRKRLTKRQILENILPFFENIAITKRERAFRGSAEKYNVEVIDNFGLSDSLSLARSSIKDFLKDMLRDKRSYKYSILAIITLKKLKAEINA